MKQVIKTIRKHYLSKKENISSGLIYYKPTFISEREIFASYARELSSRIFLIANQPLMYGCYNNRYLYKAYSRKVVVANKFVNRGIMSARVKVGLHYLTFFRF